MFRTAMAASLRAFGCAARASRPLSMSAALSSVRVRYPAPNFQAPAVVGDQIKEIKLDDYAGKWLVLFFYPLDFTFVCPTELHAFADRFDEFKKLNCELVACSTDSQFSHLAWNNMPRNKGGLGNVPYPIMSDYSKSIANNYTSIVDALDCSLRSLFLINPEGVVEHMSFNNLPVGRSVDEVLRLLEAFQTYQEKGEVCPANWKRGEKTMTPTATGAQDYFKDK